MGLETCVCVKKYPTGDLERGKHSNRDAGYFNGRNVDMMGLNHSTNSASVTFLGVFAKHCYDQILICSGGCKTHPVANRSTMISENKKVTKFWQAKLIRYCLG